MNTCQVDPIEVFAAEPLLENRVFSFVRVDERVLLITEFALDPEVNIGKEAWRKYCFRDVSNFKQLEVRDAGVFGGCFEYGPDTKTYVVSHEEVVCRPCGRYLASYWLSGLGGFSFEFSELHVSQRILNVRQEGDRYVREDAEGNRIDFYHPFGDLSPHQLCPDA